MKIEKEICGEIKKFISSYSSYCANITKIFCFFSFESGVKFSDFFIKTKSIFEKNEIDKILGIDSSKSAEKQKKYIDMLNADFSRLIEFIKFKEGEVPTLMKVIYNYETDSLNIDFAYENQYSDDDENLVDDIYEQWLEKEKK